MSFDLYSKKMARKIAKPRASGRFTTHDAKERGMRCVVGKEGFVVEGSAVQLYWLVDEVDGIIVDAKFQVFGHAALIAAAEGACELLVGKNYDQAKRLSAELIDKQLRDQPTKPAFPDDTVTFLNLVLAAIDDGAEQCSDLPLPTTYVTPMPHGEREKGEGYPGWLELDHEKKLAVIEEVLNDQVRPYVELDAGGINVVELKGNELVIAYQGACTSCFSAIGTTLASIQQILQEHIHPDMTVTPNMDELTFAS